MAFFESFLQFVVKLVCGNLEQKQDEQKPPQQQQQPHKPHKPQPHTGQQNGHAPLPQQQQQQHGKPYYQNDYMAHAQDSHYVSLRKEADDTGKEMGDLFGASREAYDSGDRARAKELSNQAKELRTKKDRLHRQAADWIFEQNNKGREPGEVDLHGLRAEEAVERTDEAIQSCRKQNRTELRLIVGKGLHSQDHKAVLKPKIEELMQKHNIVAEIDPENAGVLIVHLDSRGLPSSDRSIDPDEISRRLGDQDKSCVIM